MAIQVDPFEKPSSHCRGGAKSKIRIPMLGESVEIICFSPSLGANFSHIASTLQRERHKKNGTFAAEVLQK